ncbi:histidine phosphatase family protein [Croceicoccus sp. F390]|uniref:Histidine phosphatase family protein n=1 Tax=Croceicoccus esteveae TaxID=3075597 RepID=A0ABU2ZL36_9SPHN|nr:histidine phosphatase family protein [Croceicoccus sp. F390]MDT0577095.1 histidine phosphatase family protein [Croceicoccus sp. F390]
MALVFLRHGEPLIAPGICYGRSDIGARELSEAQLCEIIGTVPDTLYRIDTSPLSRCLMLAERLAERLMLPLQIDPRLQEIDFGRWEGCKWDDIPRNELDEWAADVTGASPHGGESVNDMTTRVRSYLDEPLHGEADILAVTHMGVVRCAHAALGYEGALEMRLDYTQTMTFGPHPSFLRADRGPTR